MYFAQNFYICILKNLRRPAPGASRRAYAYMFRTLKIMAVALVGLMMAGCTASDMYRVNQEILVSTVWVGDRFVPNGMPAESTADRYLYVFGTNGVLSVYPESSGVADGDGTEMLHYIYTPEEDKIVIDTYGVFTVRVLNVDRLRLEGATGVLDLSFYAGIDPVTTPMTY